MIVFLFVLHRIRGELGFEQGREAVEFFQLFNFVADDENAVVVAALVIGRMKVKAEVASVSVCMGTDCGDFGIYRGIGVISVVIVGRAGFA